ncbi:MAG: hypothetical protein AABZ57_01205, partial [Candidatus Margulisiibacteriota bacterium]
MASCTTNAVSTFLFTLLPFIKRLETSMLSGIHGTTAMDKATEIVESFTPKATGAATALGLVFGNALPGIDHLIAEVKRGNFTVPSFADWSCVFEGNNSYTRNDLLGAILKLALSPADAMMLGLYSIKYDPHPSTRKLAHEGRTISLRIDDTSFVLDPIRSSSNLYYLRATDIIYDNVYGFANQGWDTIIAWVNAMSVLPYRLPWIKRVMTSVPMNYDQMLEMLDELDPRAAAGIMSKNDYLDMFRWLDDASAEDSFLPEERLVSRRG